jgi:hypothetical protein
LPRLDLADLPAADIVANSHTLNFCRRAGAYDGARVFAIHDDAEQSHIGWRRRRWRRYRNYRRRRRRMPGRRKQWTIAGARDAVERLRCERADRGRTIAMTLGVRRRVGRKGR